jgi:hypothetical protein
VCLDEIWLRGLYKNSMISLGACLSIVTCALYEGVTDFVFLRNSFSYRDGIQ